MHWVDRERGTSQLFCTQIRQDAGLSMEIESGAYLGAVPLRNFWAIPPPPQNLKNEGVKGLNEGIRVKKMVKRGQTCDLL